MAFVSEIGFGTSSCSFIGLGAAASDAATPEAARAGRRVIWRFAAGLPGTVPYQPVKF
jgi:hypothetical protein